MGRTRGWVAAIVLMAFGAGCGGQYVVHEPLYSVVAREETPCAKACLDQPAENEQQAADCLTSCEGARKVDEQSCAEAGRAGHACATSWRERPEDHRTAKAIGWGVGGSVVAVVAVFGLFYLMLSPFAGAHP